MSVKIECQGCGHEKEVVKGYPTTLACQCCGCYNVFINEGKEPLVIQCVKCEQVFKVRPLEVFKALHYCNSTIFIVDPDQKKVNIKQPLDCLPVSQEVIRGQVDAVVVCHNQLRYTKKCIDQLRLTSCKKIILVDNGSTNSTPNWALTQNLVYVRNQVNFGCGVARNQGAKWTTGEYIFFIDNDQFVQPDVIDRMLKLGKDLVGVDLWNLTPEAVPMRNKSERINKSSYVGSGGLLVKRKAFEYLQGYDERFAPAWWEDADFCLRAKNAGFSVGYLKNHEIEHKGNTTISTQKTFDSNKAKDEGKKVFKTIWGDWLTSIHSYKRSGKPKILMAVDHHGWAWDFKTQQIVKYLSDEFNFVVWYYTDAKEIPEDCDLYFTFDVYMASRIKQPIERTISGVSSHTYKNFVNWQNVLKDVRAIHANSRLLYEEVKDFNDTFYLPNGVDEKHFKYVKRNTKKRFTAGFVGKPSRKGIYEYIMPACEIAGVKLNKIVGGVKRQDLTSFDEMPKFYEDIDVIMVASDKDGTPNPLLESAAIGRTFIGNRIGNIPEFVEDGVNGFMLDERRIDDYVEKLLWLKNHRIQCAEMGIEARKTIEKDWTWKNKVENYREMFREVLYG